MSNHPEEIFKRLQEKLPIIDPRKAQKRLHILRQVIDNGMVDGDGLRWTRMDFISLERQVDDQLARMPPSAKRPPRK